MVEKYAWIRVKKEAKEELNKRVKYINENDLKKLGINNKRIKQIDFTSYLFKNRMFVTDQAIKSMVKKKFKGRIC